jgi:hypothetical protein
MIRTPSRIRPCGPITAPPAMLTWLPIRVPSPITAPAPITQNGPMRTAAPIRAVGSISAVGW